jgi:hypothetical protein
MAANELARADAGGERFVHVVVWALDRVLRTEYQVIEYDENGNPVTLELSTKPLETEELEHFFATFRPLQPEVREAILALKERHTREDIERVLRLLPSTAPEEASELAERLDGAAWPDIARVVDRQLSKHAQIGAMMGDVLVREREGFSTRFGRDAEQFLEERSPEVLALMAAHEYAKDFRDMFPEMVRRARELRLLPASEKAPEYVRRYLVEATRCFIYGHFLASLTVCRSAIEEGVKQRLVDMGKREEVQKDDRLVSLLRLARCEGLLDNKRFQMADAIRERARKAVHGKKLPEERECIESFHQTRGVLEHLYGRLQ